MRFLYEKYNIHVNNIIQKYPEEDAGFDLQSFGISECPCDPAEIPLSNTLPIISKINSTYKIFTGIIALITLLSGIVTIIQGKEKTIELINELLGQ